MCGETRLNPRYIYLIKRGPRPLYHVAPYHPFIICTHRHTAKWEAGSTADRSTVWSHQRFESYSGWLLERWKGFDVDYGGVVRSIEMPDGTTAAFVHDKNEEPWTLLCCSVWWSLEPIPQWLAEFGIRSPKDQFSRDEIIDDAGHCLLSQTQQERLWESRDNRFEKGKLLNLFPSTEGAI